MKLKYLQDTDTIYIEFKVPGIIERKDLDENMVVRDDNPTAIYVL